MAKPNSIEKDLRRELRNVKYDLQQSLKRNARGSRDFQKLDKVIGRFYNRHVEPLIELDEIRDAWEPIEIELQMIRRHFGLHETPKW